jgi:hypothetical protein
MPVLKYPQYQNNICEKEGRPPSVSATTIASFAASAVAAPKTAATTTATGKSRKLETMPDDFSPPPPPLAPPSMQQQQRHHHRQLAPSIPYTQQQASQQQQPQPPPLPLPQQQPSHAYDPAVRHPVFFTNTLFRLPFPVPDAAAQPNPVAHGYISDTRRTDAKGSSKL